MIDMTPEEKDALLMCECGAPIDDGEGWDGMCGDCADIAEDQENQ